MLGELSALGASACWALSAFLFGRVGDELDAVSLAAVQGMVVTVVMSIVMAASGVPAYWAQFGHYDLLLLAVSGTAGLVLGEVVHFRALNRLGPRLSLVIWSLSPGAAVVVAFAWLGERPTIGALVGIVVTIVGIGVAVLGRRRPPETPFRAATTVDIGGPEALEGEEGVDVKAILAALAGPMLMGVSFTALGGIAATSAALAVHTVRFAAATTLLLVIVAATRRFGTIVGGLQDAKRSWLLMAAIGSGTLVGSGLATYAVLMTDVATAITLSSLGPIFILPLSRWAQGTPLLPEAIAGAIVATAGAVIVAFS